MSTFHYSPSRSAADSEQYVRGKDDDRGVAITCDVPGGPGAFARRAQVLAQKYGREVETLHYRQSFGDDEFKAGNPADEQRVNDLGYLLARKMHPHSDVLAVTHTDGKGGKVHNHILVINHDNETNRALSDYRSFHDRPEQGQQRGVQSANDELMREHGLSVARDRQLSPRDWELRREQFAEGSLDREAGDRFMAALTDPRSTDRAGLMSVIDEQNAEPGAARLRLHSATSKKTGRETWTLYIEDKRGEGKRAEHRKRASQYSREFTPEGVGEFFAFHTEQKERGHARTGQDEAASRAAAERARLAREQLSIERDFEVAGDDHGKADRSGDRAEESSGLDLGSAQDDLRRAAERHREHAQDLERDRQQRADREARQRRDRLERIARRAGAGRAARTEDRSYGLGD